MNSSRTSNKPVSGSINLPNFILPLLVLNVTFTSKPVFPDYVLHQLLSLLFILCAILVFYRSSSNKPFALSVVIALVLLRFLRVGSEDQNGLIHTIYFVPYAIMILGVGTKMLRDYPLLMFRQIAWISVISIILSFLQIMSVQWAQSLTNYYWYKGGGDYSYLFVSWLDLPGVSGLQIRPVGFSSANNITSQYLSFFYAFTFLWFTANNGRYKPSLMWAFIVAFACALTGAKIVVLIIFLVNIMALLIVKQKILVFRLFLVTCLAYFCYWLLFPGLFVFNFNLDIFAFNAMIRVTDLLLRTEIPYSEYILSYLSQYQTGEFIGRRSVLGTVKQLGGNTISGVGSIIEYIQILVMACLLLLPFWIFRLRKLTNSFFVDTKKLPFIMLMAVIGSALGGPFLFTPYFWFFFSFVLYPLTVLFVKKYPGTQHDFMVAKISYT